MQIRKCMRVGLELHWSARIVRQDQSAHERHVSHEDG